jgi:hypothetical protein
MEPERQMSGMGKLTMSARLTLALLAIAVATPPALAQNRNRAPSAAQPVRSGVEEQRPNAVQTRPLPDIVARVQATPPYSGMDYVGVADYDERAMIYVLRFIDGRRVVVVNVDARSGRILGSAR